MPGKSPISTWRASGGPSASSLISQALSVDDADANAAGEVGFMARAVVQATMPHSDPKTNEFVRHNGCQRRLACPGFEAYAVADDHPLHGTVHTALWQHVLPEAPVPTVHARAFALALTHEATDYDRVEWNYGTADDRSAVTWGPYGATAGWGNEVRAILRRVHEQHPALLPDLFGDEFASVEALLDGDRTDGYDLLKPVYDDPQRRQAWREALQALGRRAEGRAAYDWYAFESGQWLSPNLRRLYHLVPDAAATEIDYAFSLTSACTPASPPAGSVRLASG